ncbi:MAG TPA: sensor domain-containing diguanylate cyclase, partial [Nitrospiria bacterium]|nr:sensor domain-containing diguanylate cyclase [Nitrospiria bacterium]
DQGITGSMLGRKTGLFLFGDSPRRNSAWRVAYLPLRVGDYSIGILVLQRGSSNGELLEGVVEGIAQFLAEQIGEETSKEHTSQALLKLSTLNEKGLKLLELRDVDEIISASTTSAALLVGAEAAVLRLCDNGDWWVGGSFGIDGDGPLSDMILQVDESMVQDHVISSGTPVILNSLERFKDIPKDFPYKTFIGVPVKEGTQWVGVISLYNKLQYTPLAQPVFTQEDLEILNKYVIYLARAMSQARSLETYENMPGTDPLTGLKNERYFHVRLTEELERAARYDRKLGLVIVEVDYEKEAQILNGDLLREVVRRVSFMINDTFRNVDVVARMGENRFAVILPDTGDTLMEAIARLKKNASRFSFTNGHDEPIPLKFNVGWSYFPDMATNTRDLVSLASRLSPLQIASPEV